MKTAQLKNSAGAAIPPELKASGPKGTSVLLDLEIGWRYLSNRNCYLSYPNFMYFRLLSLTNYLLHHFLIPDSTVLIFGRLIC
jgi:hypothetical protein